MFYSRTLQVFVDVFYVCRDTPEMITRKIWRLFFGKETHKNQEFHDTITSPKQMFIHADI